MSGPQIDIIGDGDALLRRVANRPNMVKREGDVVRPTSAVFNPAREDGGVSVDVRRLLADPSDPVSVLDSTPEHGLVELRAAVPRGLGLDLDVVHAPEPGNPAHANIVGLPELQKAARKRASRELALACAWVRQPGLAAGAI